MNDSPLKALISERGFDRFHRGLESHFAVHGLKYTLNYGNPNNNSAMVLDFDSSKHIGRISVWVSGECDMEILDISTGKTVFYEHHQFTNEDDFHSTYLKLFVFMRDVLG